MMAPDAEKREGVLSQTGGSVVQACPGGWEQFSAPGALGSQNIIVFLLIISIIIAP
jgi:hypothetical protein